MAEIRDVGIKLVDNTRSKTLALRLLGTDCGADVNRALDYCGAT